MIASSQNAKLFSILYSLFWFEQSIKYSEYLQFFYCFDFQERLFLLIGNINCNRVAFHCWWIIANYFLVLSKFCIIFWQKFIRAPSLFESNAKYYCAFSDLSSSNSFISTILWNCLLPRSLRQVFFFKIIFYIFFSE